MGLIFRIRRPATTPCETGAGCSASLGVTTEAVRIPGPGEEPSAERSLISGGADSATRDCCGGAEARLPGGTLSTTTSSSAGCEEGGMAAAGFDDFSGTGVEVGAARVLSTGGEL